MNSKIESSVDSEKLAFVVKYSVDYAHKIATNKSEEYVKKHLATKDFDMKEYSDIYKASYNEEYDYIYKVLMGKK